MSKNRVETLIILIFLCFAITVGCGQKGMQNSRQSSTKISAGQVVNSMESPIAEANVAVSPTTISPVVTNTPTPKSEAGLQKSSTTSGLDSNSGILKGKTICIDPGHQAKANYEPEQIAPNTSITKEKMSYGTTGVATGIPEYKLNLAVSLKLKRELEKKGAKVVMTRETNEVNTGNIERAKMANGSKSELVIRIHADGIEDSSVRGMSVLYPGGKYISDKKMLANSKLAAEKILKAMVTSTGAVNRGIVERNDLTGFNWSTIPVILVEMGFMTNEAEDKLLNTQEYQDKVVSGIIKGIEDYYNNVAGN